MKRANLFFQLPRLSPGYIKYLKTQTKHNMDWLERSGPGEIMTPHIAFLLGTMGITLSGYSSRQLTLHNKPCARVLR
ncbi:uncharacterized protein zgc:193593 [Oncorhynchus keta]|uniref:uncharacterized protein zgc:193593 n=1 Tax=Oncorhynchus keta TaxID=8018 RepID=UPI00227B7C20|nr:uncharacterized protein zgc:193593 [Oncorhynchus keta]